MSSKPIYQGGNFYVYLITDLNHHSEARYYIGSATRKELVEKNIDPELDTYYGSSSVVSLFERQKTQSHELERVIIETFDDKKECLLVEEWYQRQHQAVGNPLFYNKVYANNKYTPTADSIRKMLETRNTLEWQETVGREAKRKEAETKSDPLWKETVGKKAVEDRLKTISDPEWKETTGRNMVKTRLETISTPEWKDTVGKEAKCKEAETKSDPIWQETIGKEAIRRHKETKSDPEWKDSVDRNAKVIRGQISFNRP
jgi:hypothetical protein